MNCPSCGADLKEARKASKASAKEMVEGLMIDNAMVHDAAQILIDGGRPLVGSIDRQYGQARHFAELELADFRDHMRGSGYRLSGGKGGPVRDARAAFRKWMRNAVKFTNRSKEAARPATKRMERKDL